MPLPMSWYFYAERAAPARRAFASAITFTMMDDFYWCHITIIETMAFYDAIYDRRWRGETYYDTPALTLFSSGIDELRQRQRHFHHRQAWSPSPRHALFHALIRQRPVSFYRFTFHCRAPAPLSSPRHFIIHISRHWHDEPLIWLERFGDWLLMPMMPCRHWDAITSSLPELSTSDFHAAWLVGWNITPPLTIIDADYHNIYCTFQLHNNITITIYLSFFNFIISRLSRFSRFSFSFSRRLFIFIYQTMIFIETTDHHAIFIDWILLSTRDWL